MEALLDVATTEPFIVSQADAHRTASAYVKANIDPAFEVVDGAHYPSKPMGRMIWRFFVRCAEGPLYPIQVDSETGEVIPLTSDEIRVVREKAALLLAKKRGCLPLNEQGYVISEYARRRANGYLTMEVSLFYVVSDGIFVLLGGKHPGAIWQFSIEARLPRLGVLGVIGMIDVDAQSGEVIPLTQKQIKRIRDRADALVELRTQTAAA